MKRLHSFRHSWLPVLASLLALNALAQAPATTPPGASPNRGGPGGRGGRGGGPGGALAAQLIAYGDKNADQKLSKEEMSALADAWFDKLDTDKSGKLSQAQFTSKFAELLPAQTSPGGGAPDGGRGPGGGSVHRGHQRGDGDERPHANHVRHVQRRRLQQSETPEQMRLVSRRGHGPGVARENSRAGV